MNRILERLYAKFTARLGTIAAFVPTIADKLRIAIEAGDTAKALAICDEADEAFDAGKALTAKVRVALAPDADGVSRLSGLETAEIAKAIEAAIDEAEDVATGHDEDDLPTVAKNVVDEPSEPTDG